MERHTVENPLPFPMPGVFIKASATEWGTQCPYCGGKDRFRIWRDARRKGGFKFWCRQCGKFGDAIDLLREVEGLSYPDACRKLGVQMDGAFRMKRPGSSAARPSRPKPSPPRPGGEWKPPNQRWIQKAAAFFQRCQRDFHLDWWSGGAAGAGGEPRPTAVYALGERMLEPWTCLAVGIGVNENNIFPPRSEWGLPPGENQQGRAARKIAIPEGIVIATRRDGVVVGLAVRRFDYNQDAIAKWGKYKEIPSDGDKYPFLAGELGQPVVITEGAFDAALVYERSRAIGEPCAALALNGASKMKIDPEARRFIDKAPKLILANDMDEAGRIAAAKLLAMFPKAVLAPPGGSKDLTDLARAFREGRSRVGVEDWVQWALQLKPRGA